MSENNVVAGAGNKIQEKLLDKVVPTLFIGAGGTGAEVLWRIRRRILSRVWRGQNGPTRLTKLDEFPFAEFLHIDLDSSTITESGKSSDDPLAAAIAFKPSESLVKKLDLSKYIATSETLDRFPHVKEWFPLTPERVSALKINPEKGAGQIRSISTLYFVDRYQEIKSSIAAALSNLRVSVQNEQQHKKLGLTLMEGNLRVVVVASTAGGTGSGAAIDLGYLSKVLFKTSGATGQSVQLFWMLPTGYTGANATRTQANTYAALMEIEAAMRSGSQPLRRWSDSESAPKEVGRPYDDVYFIDTENVAHQKTKAIGDCYEMLADVLFEDFSTSEFANRKRSVAVNQNQHKSLGFSPRLSAKYGDMKLSYSRAYSVLGQSILDTQIDQKQSMQVERCVQQMLSVFFGVAIESERAQQKLPTDKDRDDLLHKYLHLSSANFGIEYQFATNHAEWKQGEQQRYAPIVNELLRIDGKLLTDSTTQTIGSRFDLVVDQVSDYKQWPAKLKELLVQVRRDAIKTVEPGSGVFEDAVRNRRRDLLQEYLHPERPEGLIKAFWARVDDKERGGLDFTIELIQRIKDQIDNPQTGYALMLEQAGKRFADLAGFIDTDEIATLQDHLDQAISQWFGAQDNASTKWKQLTEACQRRVEYHLRSVACFEAADLVRDVSKRLGERTGTNAQGRAIWSGFIGELERGRLQVDALMAACVKSIERTQAAMNQEHAMYVRLDAVATEGAKLSLINTDEARKWAAEVFQDSGGTQKLFKDIAEPGGEQELLFKVRNYALSKLAAVPGAMPDENPLFAALRAKNDGGKELLKRTMQRAMPWAALKLHGYLDEAKAKDQYKCILGVQGSEDFKRDFSSMLGAFIPIESKMTAEQIGFVEIAEPGRLVCYVELSGVPLPALRDLDGWHHAYKQEEEKNPLHTHKHVFNFVHARELSEDFLQELISDFKLMLQALMLRVLQRKSSGDDAGNLMIKIGAMNLSSGSEKMVRLNGFRPERREAIKQQVEEQLSRLSRPEQRALYHELLLHYYTDVYPSRIFRNDSNEDLVELHLPTKVCKELLNESEKSLKALPNWGQLSANSKAAFELCTEVLEGSETDASRAEVGSDGIDLKPKRALKVEVFNGDWALPSIAAAPAPLAAAQTVLAAAAPMMAAPASNDAAVSAASAIAAPSVYTPEQVAQLLGVSLADVLAELESGNLKGKKIGPQWRISQKNVEAFLDD